MTFTCTRFRCTMKKTACVERQQIAKDIDNGCRNCDQGKQIAAEIGVVERKRPVFKETKPKPPKPKRKPKPQKKNLWKPTPKPKKRTSALVIYEHPEKLKCTVPGCPYDAIAKGKCRTHYQAEYRARRVAW